MVSVGHGGRVKSGSGSGASDSRAAGGRRGATFPTVRPEQSRRHRRPGRGYPQRRPLSTDPFRGLHPVLDSGQNWSRGRPPGEGGGWVGGRLVRVLVGALTPGQADRRVVLRAGVFFAASF